MIASKMRVLGQNTTGGGQNTTGGGTVPLYPNLCIEKNEKIILISTS